MRANVHSIIPALLLGAAVVLTGCAGDGNTGGGSMGSSASVSSDRPPSADLQISILADGTNESDHYSLQCNGAHALETSAHPHAAEACAWVEKEPKILKQPKPDAKIACTEQYGGPAVARVSGTFHGQAVERRFDLANGCSIAQWQSALVLLVLQPGLQ